MHDANIQSLTKYALLFPDAPFVHMGIHIIHPNKIITCVQEQDIFTPSSICMKITRF